MSDQNNPPTIISTPQNNDQMVAENVASNLSQVLGNDISSEQVTPATAAPAPPLHVPLHKMGVTDDQLNQVGDVTDRLILSNPGTEPSKSFLKKLLERVKKKNPDADVELVKK